MKNTTYFTILVFLFLGCFAIGPLIDMQDWIPIFTLVWIILGYATFKAEADSTPVFVKYFTLIIIGSVFVSFISASKNYNVDFFSSLLTNRQMLLYLAFPLIFRLELSDFQIFRTLKYLFLIPLISKAIELTAGVNPLHGTNNYITSENLQDLGIFIEGMPFWTLLAYFFICQWFENIRDKKKLLYAVMGGLCVIITFNRSMTIPFLALTFFFYLKRKNKTGWLLGSLVISAVLFIMWPVLQSMIFETQQQAGDEDYARNAAIQHFIVDSTPGLFEQIFGNSLVGASNAASAAMFEFRKASLFSLVDLGWIGFYYQYGIFPIIMYLCLIIKIIRSQTAPPFVKMMAIHLLFPIGWNMWLSQYMLISIVLIYLYYYYQNRPYGAQYLSKI